MNQITKSYEIIILSSGEGQDRVITPYLPPTGERNLSQVLDSFAMETDEFMQGLKYMISSCDQYPWAIMAFPKEYKLAGHIYSRRIDPEDPQFSSYTLIREGGGRPMDKPPSCSIMVFYNKSAASNMKERGHLFQTCWSCVRGLPEDRSWLILAPALDQNWVSKTEEGDAALFYAHYEPTEYDLILEEN